ncbi:MAG: molybdenum cofactor guanylyltransferase [Actinomycetes bacterium]
MQRRGYVLAGGSSRRMGVDKAFLPVSSQSAVERQCHLLQDMCSDGVFIVGRNKELFASYPWVHLEDQGGGQGPLDGIATALSHAQDGIAFILAVDLFMATKDDFDALDLAMSQTEADVAHAYSTSDTHIEVNQPLCSAWRVSSTLDIVNRSLAAGERKVSQIVETLQSIRVLVPFNHLANFNSPEDFSRLKS